MNKRIRQGLGLLVVSAISFIVVMVLSGVLASLDVNLTYQVLTLVQAVIALAFIVSLLAGLIVLAWGLLRPPREVRSTDE